MTVTTTNASKLEMSDATLNMVDGVATVRVTPDESDVPSKTYTGTVTGPGGNNTCMAILEVRPTCQTTFNFSSQSRILVSNDGRVTVDAYWTAAGYRDTTAVLLWLNGSQAEIVGAFNLSLTCNNSVYPGNIHWVGTEKKYAPAYGAKYLLGIARGNIQVTDSPGGITWIDGTHQITTVIP